MIKIDELLSDDDFLAECPAGVVVALSVAADALEAQARRIAGLEYEARLFDEALGNAHARIAELEAALTPFADEADTYEVTDMCAGKIKLSIDVADLRTARAALNGES